MATSSLFDSIHDDFRRLDALSIDGRTIHRQLPQRQITLGELKAVLLHPSTPFGARDAMLVTLINKARSGDSQWTTAVLGVLLPGIRRSAGKLISGGCVLQAEEIEAEMIAGVVDEVATMDLSRGHVASRLTWAGFRRALEACESAAAAPPPSEHTNTSQVPREPWGHPELVLAEAAQSGVITVAEANLISATRLEGVAIAAIAASSGELIDSIRHRRRRAEKRLAKYLSRGGQAR